jgi:cob(I)alamin adenosyltransferase
MGRRRIYTRTGDDGTTGLAGGQRVAKDSPRIEAAGAVDELNSALGLALALGAGESLREELHRIQNDLFCLGAMLGSSAGNGDKDNSKKRSPAAPRIEARHVARLEASIDGLEEELEPLEEFILPGGTQAAAALAAARTVCRRAERAAVRCARAEQLDLAAIQYLNRLSDLLFVMARHENQARGSGEIRWDRGT